MDEVIQPIETPGELAEMLNVPLKRLTWMGRIPADSARYRTFEIPKSNGKKRKISEPVPFLKLVQRRIAKMLDELYEEKLVSKESRGIGFKRCAHGFVSGKSIKSNAEMHVRKEWVLNVDLKDFFPSITGPRVYGLLEDWKREIEGVEYPVFSQTVASLIANLCCFRESGSVDDENHFRGLPQGAPTSPVLSNMITVPLDNELHYFASKRKMVYTRYADDLSFSPDTKKSVSYEQLVDCEGYGKCVSVVSLKAELDERLENHGFQVQEKKTRLQVRPHPREVTGLVVNEFANVPRREVRWIRSVLDLWKTRGYELARRRFWERKQNRHSDCPKELTQVLMGKLLFFSFIRGKGDPIYLKFRKSFLALCRERSNELYQEMSKNLGEVSLDDFTKRPALHLSKLRDCFEKVSNEGEGIKLRRTELGSWAYERLDHLLGWENLSGLFTTEAVGAASIESLALKAEVSFLLMQHDKRLMMRVFDDFRKLFNSIVTLNGRHCGRIFREKRFYDIIKGMDWAKYFQKINDEYSTEIQDRGDFTPKKLISYADPKGVTITKPFPSLLYWVALNGIESPDPALIRHGKIFAEAFEEEPEFARIYELASGVRHRLGNGDSPKAEPADFREWVLKVWKAFGRKVPL